MCNIFRVSSKIQNWSYFALISISFVRRCDGKKVNVLDFTFVRKSHNCWHYECTKCPDVDLRSGHSNYLRNFLSNLLAKSWQLFLLIILRTYDLTVFFSFDLEGRRPNIWRRSALHCAALHRANKTYILHKHTYDLCNIKLTKNVILHRRFAYPVHKKWQP